MSQDNQPDELTALKAKVASNPNNLDEILNLAGAYHKQGYYYDAIDIYKRAIDLAPAEAALYYSLGTIYESIGNIDEARNAYVKAITVNPKYSRAYYKLGSMHEQRQQIPEAIQAYEKCLKYSTDPDERLEIKKKLNHLTAGIPTATGQSRLAYRLTAIVLFLGATFSIVGFFFLPSTYLTNIFSAGIDVILAIGLLQSRTGARNFTVFRAALGAIVVPVLIFMNNDIISATVATVVQWGYCGSIILLLTDQTKTWQLVLAIGLAVFALGCNGLSALLLLLGKVIEN